MKAKLAIKPIKKNFLIELFLTVCFFSFYIPNEQSVTHSIYAGWRMFCLLSIFLVFCVYLFKCINRISLKYIILSLFFGYTYAGTAFFVPSGNVSSFSLIYVVGYITLLEVSFNLYSKRQVLRSYLIAGISATLLYFATFIIYFNVDGGMHSSLRVKTGYGFVTTHQNWYIFTYDNASIFLFLPVAAALIYYCYNYNKKLYPVFIGYSSIILGMYISKMAATAMVTYVFFTFLLFYYYKKLNENKKIRFKMTYVNSIIIIIVIYIFILSFVGSDICYYIAGLLGKDGTFTGRDVIWRRSLYYIKENIIFGNGMESEGIRYLKIMMGQCHNILLEIMYDGGLVSLALYSFAVYLFRPKKDSSFSAYIFSTCLFCYYLASGFDAKLGFPYPIAIFYFSYYLKDKSVFERKIPNLNK